MKTLMLFVLITVAMVLGGCAGLDSTIAKATEKACTSLSQQERMVLRTRINNDLAGSGHSWNGVTCRGDE